MARAERCFVLVTLLTALACGDGATSPHGTDETLREQAIAAGLAPLPRTPAYPTENTYVAERVELGRLLFFDPILSGPRDVACSTCHLPRFAFGDGRQFASGAGATSLGPERTDPAPAPLRLMPRNSLTMLNVGLHGENAPQPGVRGTMFWGGGAFGLEAQVLNPIAADNELRGLTYAKGDAIDSVLLRLRAIPEYVDHFERAYPEIRAVHGRDASRLVTHTTLARALAAYLRELITPDAPFDRFLDGDPGALSQAEKAGLRLFIGKAGCVNCHSGPQLSDFRFYVIGVRQVGIGRDTTPGDDLGRGENGGVPYSFRTAPLRQVALTAPYFHDGVAATLGEVLDFKNRGVPENPRIVPGTLSPYTNPLGLTPQEIAEVIAFLAALTDTLTVQRPLFQAPDAVPSGLTVPR